MRVLLVLGLALVACLPLSSWSAASTSRTSNAQDISLSSVDARGSSVSHHQATDRVDLTLPLSFEANRGQTDPRVTFLAHGQGYTVFLTATEAVLALQKPVGPTSQPMVSQPAPTQAVVRLQFVGANPRATVTGLDELPGKINYFMGRDPRLWRTGIATYTQVKYANLYPGVTLLYYGTQRQLEYDFIVAPQSDPRQIGWSVSGAQKMWVDGTGNLRMVVAGTQLVEPAPRVYQMVHGVKHTISVGYVVTGERVGFDVGTYNPDTTLVIDPVLSYSTYLGGSGDDFPFYMDLDSSGDVYLAGFTNSTNFPTTAGAFQTAYAGGPDDVFVTKLNPKGSGLVFSTYLGGTGDDLALGVATDPHRNVYVVGTTSSKDFPTTPGAFQRTYGGGPHDGFVTKLNATGSALVYSTYLGGSGGDQVIIGPTDASGQVYAEGFTSSHNFPTTPGAFQTSYTGGPDDAFVTKLNQDGTGLVYSTFLGGTGDDFGIDGTVDRFGHAYVTGLTSSTDFPTTAGAFQTSYAGDNSDGFVTKLNSTGSALVYSTYLGGSGDDGSNGSGVGIDQGCNGDDESNGQSNGRDHDCNVFVNGFTNSVNFPTTAGAFQRSLAGGIDVFSAKLTFEDEGVAPDLVRRGPASRSARGSTRQSGSLLGRAGWLCSVSPLGCLPRS
jgi:hypothetical protein